MKSSEVFYDTRTFVFLIILPSLAAYGLYASFGLVVALVFWVLGTLVLFFIEKNTGRNHIKSIKGKILFCLLACFNLGACFLAKIFLNGDLDYFTEVVVGFSFIITLIAINIIYSSKYVIGK